MQPEAFAAESIDPHKRSGKRLRLHAIRGGMHVNVHIEQLRNAETRADNFVNALIRVSLMKYERYYNSRYTKIQVIIQHGVFLMLRKLFALRLFVTIEQDVLLRCDNHLVLVVVHKEIPEGGSVLINEDDIRQFVRTQLIIGGKSVQGQIIYAGQPCGIGRDALMGTEEVKPCVF